MTLLIKHLIYSMTAVLLSVSCAFAPSDNKSGYSMEYPIGNYTTIVRNNRPVTNIEAYMDASVELQMQVSNGCMFVLNNIITGQPTVPIIGSYKISHTAKNEEEIVFSGSKETADRAVEIRGTIRNTLLCELYIQETISSNISGRWIIERLDATFKEDSASDKLVNTVLNRTFDTLNRHIENNIGIEDKYIAFTSSGFIDFYRPTLDGIIEYYLRKDLGLLNLYIDKTNIGIFTDTLKQHMIFVDILDQLGLSSILDIDYSLSMPAYFSINSNVLTLTLDQSLIGFYLSLEKESLLSIRDYISHLTYKDIQNEIADSVWGKIITENNFKEQQEVVLIIADALIEGNAKYSFSIHFTPYTE